MVCFLSVAVVIAASTGGGLSLADFAKQRQQEAELEQQFREEGEEGRRNQDLFNEEGEGDESSEEEPESLADIQSEREKEFLDMFCEPVHQHVPEDVACSIVEELADRLHHMLTAAVQAEVEAGAGGGGGAGMDPDDFDEVVVRCLQAEALQTDMAAARDLMLTYVQDRM